MQARMAGTHGNHLWATLGVRPEAFVGTTASLKLGCLLAQTSKILRKYYVFVNMHLRSKVKVL